jgi:hypothetical protein
VLVERKDKACAFPKVPRAITAAPTIGINIFIFLLMLERFIEFVKSI